jgi:uncharacterized LabA/DUF88 family protein
MVDGGFLKKKLYQELDKRLPRAKDIVEKCREITQKPPLEGHELFRVFYYDAPPLAGATITNPIDGKVTDFSSTRQARHHQSLLDTLELEESFAVRKGELSLDGWKITPATIKNITKDNRPLEAGDFTPDIKQKGVDMRIGIDIAWLSLKKIVDILVLVTGDSDFVPVTKLARREGLLVYLDHLGHKGIKRELKMHADRIL